MEEIVAIIAQPTVYVGSCMCMYCLLFQDFGDDGGVAPIAKVCFEVL